MALIFSLINSHADFHPSLKIFFLYSLMHYFLNASLGTTQIKLYSQLLKNTVALRLPPEILIQQMQDRHPFFKVSSCDGDRVLHFLLFPSPEPSTLKGGEEKRRQNCFGLQLMHQGMAPMNLHHILLKTTMGDKFPFDKSDAQER